MRGAPHGQDQGPACRNCGRPRSEHKQIDDPPLYIFCRAGPPGTPGWWEAAPGNPEYQPASADD